MRTLIRLFLLLAILIGLCLVVPLKYKQLGCTKTFVIPLLGVLLFMLNMERILEASTGLIERFSEHRYNTLHGRIYSAQYLLERLLDPKWWIPQGYSDFLSSSKNIPHFNPAAFYLEGGILALIAWFFIFATPLARLAGQFFRGRMDSLAVMIFSGALVVFAAQLSLNVPFQEQVWLWAGAVIGTDQRIQIGYRQRRREALIRQRNPALLQQRHLLPKC